MPKISVIVPVYKVEQYLHRCVCSIFEQTYTDFELILVDDGSPDNCPGMCDEYAGKDGRIKVIHQENGGLSAARNTGLDWALENSDSEYITFIDSDDWVHPQFLEIMLKCIVATGAGVTVCRHKYTEQELAYSFIEYDTHMTEVITAEALLVNRWRDFNYAWAKLYRKELFRKVRYPEGRIFEDTFTTYKVLFESNMVACVCEELYYYFKNSAGITRSVWSAKNLDCIEGIKEQLAFYRDNGYAAAFEKEQELFIEQLAYQIHRIREDKTGKTENLKYLYWMRTQMLTELRREKKYKLRDNLYWYEAVYPVRAGIKAFFHRIVSGIHNYGISGFANKVRNRIWEKTKRR